VGVEIAFEEVSKTYPGARDTPALDRVSLEIAAGEYAYVPADFRNLVGCVDCLQADVTRCGGITPMRHVAGLADAHGIEVSAHCAPQVSAHAFCAARLAAEPGKAFGTLPSGLDVGAILRRAWPVRGG